MIRYSLVIGCIFSVTLLFGQHIQGVIAKDHRKMLTHYSDTIQGGVNGIFTIQFSVNAEGNVASTKVIDEIVAYKNSFARIQAMNYVRKFKFEPGTWFPKYHQGKVKIYMHKK